MKMALVKHDKSKHEVTPRRTDFFDRFFDDWPEMFRRPVLLWPEREFGSIGVEEFTEDGALVVRVEDPRASTRIKTLRSQSKTTYSTSPRSGGRRRRRKSATMSAANFAMDRFIAICLFRGEPSKPM